MKKNNIANALVSILSTKTIRCKTCGSIVLKDIDNEPGKFYWCPKHGNLYEYETINNHIEITTEEKEELTKELEKIIFD